MHTVEFLFILLFCTNAVAFERVSDTSIMLSEVDKKNINADFFQSQSKPILISGVKYQLPGKEGWTSQIKAIFKASRSSLGICKSRITQASFVGKAPDEIDYGSEIKSQHYDGMLVWLQKEKDCDEKLFDEAIYLSEMIDERTLLHVLSNEKALLEAVVRENYKTNVPIEQRKKYESSKISSIDVVYDKSDIVFKVILDRGSKESWLSVTFELIKGEFNVRTAYILIS